MIRSCMISDIMRGLWIGAGSLFTDLVWILRSHPQTLLRVPTLNDLTASWALDVILIDVPYAIISVIRITHHSILFYSILNWLS